MPTMKRRITVTLSPSLDLLLKAIARAGGASQSAVVVEILEAAEPTLQRMAEGFQRLRQASEADRRRMTAALDVAMGVIEPMALEVVAGMEEAVSKATGGGPEAVALAERSDSGLPRSAGVSPPLGNTGGRSPRKTTMAKRKVRAVAGSPVKSAM